MRLTKTTSHAIRILVDCAAANDQLLKTADIADRLSITPLNVLKIVHILSKAGLVEAVRGRNGGVRLARPAETIKIGEVVRLIEATEVGVEARKRRGGAAPINSIFDEALEAFIGVLDQHTLADMAGAGVRKRATARTRSTAARVKRSMLVRG